MFTRIWAMSDLHGSFRPIEAFWNRNKDNINFSRETDCIILLGDVGANYFFNYRDRNFKQRLGKYPFTYFCIRGNHEERVTNVVLKDEENWEQEIFFSSIVWVEKQYPYIKYAEDYPMKYYINEYKTLVIPGAYSVDKYHRIQNNLSWFKGEQLTKEEMDFGRVMVQNEKEVDLILSHTCPIIYEPTDLFLPFVDQSTVDRTMERYLGEIECQIDYKLWLWGHFHAYRVYPKHNNRQCVMLSAGEEAINILDWLTAPDEIHQRY